ncbi:MAG: diutan polysaccharide export protein [Phenylobacterium zucineum]|nr:MAG: diutan polysaccharide export protein [Phenylobacterium zucineum]
MIGRRSRDRAKSREPEPLQSAVPGPRPGIETGEQAFSFDPSLVEAMTFGTPTGRACIELAEEVILRHFGLGRRGLAVCGASAGGGATFVSASLAAALAQSGVPTLLIEANLRDPGLNRLIHASLPAPGLLQYLRSEAAAIDVMLPDVAPGLAVLFAGGTTSGADELLCSVRFRDLLTHCLRDYAAVIVDTPPANRYADARTVAAAVGYAAIVARREYSYVNDAALLTHQLSDAGVTVIGSVFNYA